MKALHQIYAWMFGYFWLPCPKCGAMFGGHQVAVGGAHVIVTEGNLTHCYCVCPACDTAELRAENEAERPAPDGRVASSDADRRRFEDRTALKR